jgi:rhamnogalacturonyl hydrolase YesR
MDLQAPAGSPRETPPPAVRDRAWVWCETAGNLGDSLPPLSRVTGDSRFAERAIRQVLTTHRWCFAPELSLWYHVGRPTGPERRSVPWGRGNGWFLYGLRGLLEDLPAGHPARAELSAALAAGLEGLLRCQGPHGLWHNVLDATDGSSREETSGAWMIVNTYARAWWRGWLRDERIPPMVERAWQGLKTRLWRGLPLAHCTGTSYMFDRQAYLARPQTRFLGHPLLLALIERRRMLQAHP